ncbi:MAG: twin-arginine translocase TatA/TatE family subunit [Flavobacteriales bacterium]|jgi:sec-independent protein translocase protein TatA|nr:twin-arginine translocase TatA/TatE family subunit [Flavobacteriales bacterium]|tara:strand:+ start:341 stop:544 length:204 start_codon:yes stop_codon:yes gene_type:complete
MKLDILLFIGSQEIIIIAVIILLLFGGRKIPELMRGLGSGIKEFKDAAKDEGDSTPPIESKEKKDIK